MNFEDFNNFSFSKSTNENLLKPSLVGGGVKYFMGNALKECNKFKMYNYNLLYNIGMFFLFIIVIGGILFYKYKGNITKEERYNKNIKDKQYIMSKLVYFNKQNLENQQRIKNNMITNLPDFSNHPEANMLHKKIYFN